MGSDNSVTQIISASRMDPALLQKLEQFRRNITVMFTDIKGSTRYFEKHGDIAGMMMVTWFTEDLGGSPTTTAGIGHVILAGVSSITIVVASVVYGFAFRRMGRPWRVMSVFSFLIAALFVVAAPVAILTTASNSEFAGLAERAAIAPFIVWLLGVGAFAVLRRGEQGVGQATSKARVLRPS